MDISFLRQAAAFVEYVARPLTEDWRIILEELRQLNIGLTQQMMKDVTVALGLYHLLTEIVRGLTYIAVTWIICQIVKDVLLKAAS